MTDTPHFDQLSPIDGYQVQPDGSLQSVSPPEYDASLLVGDELTEFTQPTMDPARTEALALQEQELQEAILRQVEAQRAQLSQPAGNIGSDGAPHFLRMVDGVEVCGQDGRGWPCPQVQALALQSQQAEFGRQPSGAYRMPGASLDLPVGGLAADGSPELLTFEEAARAAGVDPVTFAAQVQRMREE